MLVCQMYTYLAKNYNIKELYHSNAGVMAFKERNRRRERERGQRERERTEREREREQEREQEREG